MPFDLDSFHHIAQEIEKFKQETEYVCLKLAVKDWSTFLAEVRKGNIIKMPLLPTNNIINIYNSQKSPAK